MVHKSTTATALKPKKNHEHVIANSESKESITPEVSEEKRGRGRPTNEELGLGEPVYKAKMLARAEKRDMTLEAYMLERKESRKAVKPSLKKRSIILKKNATAKNKQKDDTLIAMPTSPEVVHNVRVKHTNKHDKFSLHPANRKVIQSKVKIMMKKILANNVLHLNPIIVDNEMRIINGQHRYFAAKELGLTIYYVQGDVNAEEMLDLNASQKSLVLTDYLDSYVAQGFPEYLKVKEFIGNNRIFLYNAIGLLSGRNSQPNSELVNTFKTGSFKVKDLEHAEHVLQVRDKMREFAPDFYQQKNFTNAIAKVITATGFDETRLDIRLKKNGYGQLHQAVTTELYTKQILDVYNHGMAKNKHLMID